MDFPKHIVAVAGLITNEEGKILMMRHPQRGWEFPGGQVENGEDLITALKREVEEETGILITVGPLVGIYSNIKLFEHIPTKLILDFLGEKAGGELTTSPESLEVGWYAREEVLEMITHPVIRERMKDYLEFQGQVIYRAYSTHPYQVHDARYV